FSETDNSSDPNAGEIETHTSQGQDTGSETLSLTVTGTGYARSYVLDFNVSDAYTITEDDINQVQTATKSDLETLYATDTGSETITDHEQGTVDSSGQLHMTSFLLT